MRSLMLLSLILTTSTALAQEKPKPDKAQVKKWIQMLSSEDAAKRDEAVSALRDLGPAGFEAMLEALREKSPGTQVVKIDPKGMEGWTFLDGTDGSVKETMRGSVRDGEARIEYTLNSLGAGRYRLSATRRTGDDEAKIKDEGTLAELRKRHSFLKDMRGIRFAEFPFKLQRIRAEPQATPIRSLGITVRPVPEVLGYHLFLPAKVGYVVETVEKGGRGEKLGLQRFDVLTRSDGRWVQSTDQLARAGAEIGYLRRAREPREQSAKLR